MSRNVRRFFYSCSKTFGIFKLARYLTRNQLRILCYHGVSVGDEAQFMPMLFMDATTFQSRMDRLARLQVAVLSLEDALARLASNNLPECPVVITFDDGFYGNYAHTCSLFLQDHFPATMYLTTYYVKYPHPVFRLGVRYMFWKAGDTIDEQCFANELQKGNGENLDEWMWRIIKHGEVNCDEAGRVALARQVASATGYDYEQLAQSRIMSLLQPDELREMQEAGVDIQLHTHRHRLPLDAAEARRELEENRESIERYVHHRADHLCYPSGDWSQQHWPSLAGAGIRSAVTCDAGLNNQTTPNYALRRFLDSEEFAPIEFEAEIVGYTEILRKVRSRIRSLIGRS